MPDGLDVSIIDDSRHARGRAAAAAAAIRPAIIEPYRGWIGGRGDPARLIRTRRRRSREPGIEQLGRQRPISRPASRSSPTIRIARSPIRRCATSCISIAPGWNVIGAGEPPFVGVAIGHNERAGVGTHDRRHRSGRRVRRGAEPGQSERGEVARRVGAADASCANRSRSRAQAPATSSSSSAATVRSSTRTARGIARYALRSALLEPGTAPYLGGLRLAQARDCREFLDAAMYWKAPTENLICGDVDGNIAWQASALTPKRARAGAAGLPVPGTGSYEWDGFRTDLPRELNPARGFIATANNNIHPQGFAPPVMFKTSTNVAVRSDHAPAADARVRPDATRSTIIARMQLDALSLRAKIEAAAVQRLDVGGRRRRARARADRRLGRACSRGTARPRRSTPRGGPRRRRRSATAAPTGRAIASRSTKRA